MPWNSLNPNTYLLSRGTALSGSPSRDSSRLCPAGSNVGTGAQGRALGHQLPQPQVELPPVCLGLRIDGEEDDRLRHAHGPDCNSPGAISAVTSARPPMPPPRRHCLQSRSTGCRSAATTTSRRSAPCRRSTTLRRLRRAPRQRESRRPGPTAANRSPSLPCTSCCKPRPSNRESPPLRSRCLARRSAASRW